MGKAETAELAADATNLRKDAQIRRARLIEAAVKLYVLYGAQTPLELIAAEAGVTRTTLHRNFPDRASLSAAVAQVQYDRLAQRVAGWSDRDDAFFLAIKLLALGAVRAGNMSKVTQFRQEMGPLAEHFVSQAQAMLEPPLARAKAAGLVRADFTIEQAYRAVLMIAGGSLDNPHDSATAEERIEQSLELLRLGLNPR
jgi:AcrR family transcriptional regulator